MNLTPVQQQAVYAPMSLALSAGAGSGKTRVLTERIVHLLEGGVPPAQILAVTFTDLAATELRDRLRRAAQERLPTQAQGRNVLQELPLMQVSTLHSLCARVAREHPVESGAGLAYDILEPSDAQLWRTQHLPQVLAALPPHLVAAVPAGLRTPLLETMLNDPLRAEQAAQQALLQHPDPTLQAAVLLYQSVQRDLTTLKASHEVATFGDLESLAWAALQHLQVRAYYHARWTHVLVDEMQDTTPQQWAILQALLGEHTSLTIVGDDKQSIYAFRGAAPDVLSGATQAVLERGGQELHMHDSFRSSPSMVSTVNAAMIHLMPGPDATRPTATPFRPLQAARARPPEELQSSVELHVIQGGSAATRAESAARVVAGRMQALIGQPVQDKVTGEWRGARPADMALLLRSRTHLAQYQRALHEAGLPYVVHGGQGLYQRPEVQDTITFLRTLADPSDDLLLSALLRGPYVNWTDDELLQLAALRKDRQSLWLTLQGSPHACHRLHTQRLTTWREKSATLSVSQLLTLVDDETGVAQIHAAQQGGERRLANLRLFRTHLRRWAQAGLRDLMSVARRLGQLQHLRVQEGEAQATHPDAIQVMTVHAAKGLEFPIVFYPDALRHHAPPPPRVRLDRHVGLVIHSAAPNPHWSRAQENLKEVEQSEAERINYVAMTRPADHLVLIAGASDAPKSRGALQTFISAFPDTAPRHYHLAGEVPASPPLPLQVSHGRLILDLHAGPGLTLPGRLPVTSLTTYARCPRQFAVKYLAGYLPLARLWQPEDDDTPLEQPRRAAGRDIGDAVHRAIEHGWTARDIARHGKHLAPGDRDEVLRLVERLQEPAFQDLREYEFQREVPLSHHIGPLTFQGIADAVDLQYGLVVDYKTDRVLEPQHHLHQLSVYAHHVGATHAALAYLRHDHLHWFNPADLERGYREVWNLVERMTDHDFEPTPLPQTCRACPYRGVCDQAALSLGVST